MTPSAVAVGFIGGGHMATAMVRGLLRSGHPGERILIGEPDPGQRVQLAAMGTGLTVTADNGLVAAQSDVLVLAVKPQVMAQAASAIAATSRRTGQLVLSVAAGVTLEALGGWLGRTVPIVRVMPNQPATIGSGISALIANPVTDEGQRRTATYVAASTGSAVWLADEALMDAVTAVSGSGPAYFYLFMECMERAAVDLGLPAELAQRLTRETALGAARVVVEPGESPATLRAAVTSPGGTTAAALREFAESDLAAIVERALRAARDRGRELGRASGSAGPAPRHGS
jgi:pyrroline-5-carboxylate reductase